MKGTKKLKDIFMDMKIPQRQRRLVPVVTTASGEVIWAAGVKRSDRFRVTGKTKRVLRLFFQKGNGPRGAWNIKPRTAL